MDGPMNILKEIQEHRGFHTSIVSSFTADLSAYEDLLLHRIEQSGTYNNLLLIDKRMYQDEMTKLMNMQDCLNRKALHAGQRYSLYPTTVRGAFHPKIYLFLGRNKARMYLGSANVSPAGLGRNRELMFDFRCSQEDSSERVIIQQAFQFLLSFLHQQHGDAALFREQLDFVRRESPWLFADEGETNDGKLFLLEDGTSATLLLSNNKLSTFQRLLELVGDDPVDQLTIISPYWDGNLQTLLTLQERLQPEKTNLLIQPDRAAFPSNEIKNLPGLTRLYRGFSEEGAGFMHAKMILVSTADVDHLICGSANCTAAALGTMTSSSVNAEASLYRRLPAGTVLSELGLDIFFTPEHLMLPADIPESRTGDPPTGQNGCSAQAEKYPGTIELEAGRIRWVAAPDLQSENAVLLLFNQDFDQVAELTPLEGFRYVLPEHINAQGLLLARFRLTDGELTAPAFIHHKQTLRRARYKSGNSLIRDLMERYDRCDAPIGLDLLEIIQKIEAENIDQSIRENRAHSAGKRNDSGKNESGEVLSREDFIRVRSVSADTRNLGISHAALIPVRDILNRYYRQPVEQSSSEVKNIFDDSRIYDEDATDEKLLSSDGSESDQESSEISQKRIQESLDLQRSQIIKVVDNYGKELKTKSSDTPIQAVDMLKLRLLLEIILSSALLTEAAIIRVVPEYKGDRDTLCHLAGKVLFAFFAGSHPPADQVVIPEGLEEYPIDYMETWECCCWTVKKLCKLADNISDLSSLLQSLKKLEKLIIEKIPYGQVQRDEINDLINHMTKRYGSGNK